MQDQEQTGQEANEDATSQNPQTTQDSSGGVDLDHAKQMAKEAFEDAKGSFKDLLADPMGGIAKVASTFNKSQLMMTGGIFTAISVISLFLFWRGIILGINPFMAKIWKFSYDFKLFISCVVPVAAIILGFIILGKIFGKSVTFDKCLFTSGVAYLPLSFTLIIGWVAAKLIESPNLVAGIVLFGLCFFVLLVYAGILEVLKIGTRLAFFMTPSLILFTIIASYFMYKIMFT